MVVRVGLPERGRDYDVCVVGAGPLGIALALRCADRGLSVALLEAGGADASHAVRADYGAVTDPSRHAPLDIAVCRALGGSTWWWGGRCVPFDPIDFEPRDHVPDSGWPIAYDDVAVHFDDAAGFLGCGASFRMDGDERIGGSIRTSSLERWVFGQAVAEAHGERLAESPWIDVCLHAGIGAFAFDGPCVRSVRGDKGIAARTFVLAGGGLGTTRLLAASGLPLPALGHRYMGHVSGVVADIVLNDPDDFRRFDFQRDGSHWWVRRRLTIDPDAQHAHRLPNIAFWLDNPAFDDPRHGNGLISLAYLALSVPWLGRRLVSEAIRRAHIGSGGRYLAHLVNIVRHPLTTMGTAGSVLRDRYLRKPRRPGFLLHNAQGRYALHYHGEQRPDRRSHAIPTPSGGLEIDLRYSEDDAASVLRAHDFLDAELRSAGRGRLEYHHPPDQRVDAILAQASDGFHQIGLARMGTDAATSVVDQNCRVHGTSNLYVASTAVFPTSGQAGSTFTGVALALRLADHLAERLDAVH